MGKRLYFGIFKKLLSTWFCKKNILRFFRFTIFQARRMFDGEFASLEAMYNTKTIRVPKPIKVFWSSNYQNAFFENLWKNFLLVHTFFRKNIEHKTAFKRAKLVHSCFFHYLFLKILQSSFQSISDGNRNCLVTEYIDLHGPSKPSQLGRDLARLQGFFASKLLNSGWEMGFVNLMNF